MPRDDILEQLQQSAQDAYLTVRVRIIDQIPSPARIELAQLDDRQREALLDLERAETDLALYRESMYAGI